MAPAWLSAPLGWKQLRHRPLRLLVAVAGISFAVLLIMMQLGFRAALFSYFAEEGETSRAVDAPDGTLYMADMYREIYEHPDAVPPSVKK